MKTKTHTKIITIFFGVCAIIGMIAISTIPYFVMKPQDILHWIICVALCLLCFVLITMFVLGLFVTDLYRDIDEGEKK